MPSPNAAQLERMSATARRHMPDSCTIYTQTNVDDNWGSTTTTAVRASGVACRVAQPNGQELQRSSIAAAVADAVVVLPFDQEVQQSDRIDVTIAATGAVLSLQVTAVSVSSWPVSKRVMTRNQSA